VKKEQTNMLLSPLSGAFPPFQTNPITSATIMIFIRTADVSKGMIKLSKKRPGAGGLLPGAGAFASTTDYKYMASTSTSFTATGEAVCFRSTLASPVCILPA
jgi:hypothetical protein